MTATVALYSKLYLVDDESWSARPSPRLLEYLHGLEGEDTARWIAVLGGIRVALGDPEPPSRDNRWKRNLYVPQWILESAGMAGEGEEIQVRFERCEVLPKATKLGFKILGDVPEGIDMRELLEEPLSCLGALEAGQILPAPVLEGIHLLVQTCEPEGGAVFLDGAEVALEIEEETPPTPPAPRAPTPIPAAPTHEFFDQPMVPMVPVAPQSIPTASRTTSCPSSSTGFVPFSGVGRRLCD